jgi:tetratricopeptide (TPR) repeat protein
MGLIRDARRTAIAGGLLVAATLAAFWPTFHNGFVGFDDTEYLFNLHVKNGLSWTNLRWAFLTAHSANWHPITWLSHMLDVQFFGLNPFGHHLVSLVFHISNSVLLLFLLEKLTGKLVRAFFVAALFALHPLHVESVAWAAERKDVLSTFLFLLTLLSYVRFVELSGVSNGGALSQRWETGEQQGKDGGLPDPSFLNRPALFYALALACFALGLMSKPMLVTLPFVLLLLDYWPLGRPVSRTLEQPRLIREKLPFFGMAAVSSLITFLVQHEAGAMDLNLSLNRRLINAVASYVRYLSKTFYPTNLAIYYPHPDSLIPSGQWPVWGIGIGALALVLLSAACVLWLKRAPWCGFGWFWYVGTLFPVIGIVQVGAQGLADRYTYIPLIGIFIVVVWAAAELGTRHQFARGLIGACGVAALLACGILTRHQLKYWQRGLAAFQHAAEVSPRSAVARSTLAWDHLLLGDHEAAKPQFKQALSLDPFLWEAHDGLGVLLEKQGRTNEALTEYRAATVLRPKNADPYKHLSALYWRLGERSDALELCQTALRLNPEDVDEQLNLGGMLWQIGQRNQAVAHYREAVRVDPQHPIAHYNLGFALSEMGMVGEGAKELAEAVRLAPQYADAWVEYGRALATLGDFGNAQEQFRRALELSPTNVNVRVNLANALWMSGRTNEAASNFAAAANQQPGLGQDLLDSGKRLAAQGQFAGALGRFSLAMRLRPDWPEAMSATAWVMATAPQSSVRNGPEAVRLAERAAALTGKKDVHVLATLDAAYAEAGRFPEAITAAEETRNAAAGAGNEQAVRAAKNRLERYQRNQAAHD